MDTRTFRAATMIEALQVVQKELGSDAIVVSMRETETGLWHKPCFEIVAAKPALRTPAMKTPRPHPALAEPKIEPEAAPKAAAAASDAQLKENLAAAIAIVTAKAPAAAVQPAGQPSRPAPAATKEARPFTPEVLSKRISTRTWIVSDEDAREDVRPETIEKRAAASVRATAPTAAPAALLPQGSVKLAEQDTLPMGVPAARPALIHKEVQKTAALDDVEETVVLNRMRTLLLNQGIDASLVERLNRACAASLSPARLADASFVASYLKKQLLANLRPAIKIGGEGRRVICLIGSSGAGKTSVCAKLAAQFSLREGKQVAWIEANTVRTGAIAEARMITDSFGVDLHLVYGPEDLADALANTQDADLVLMDTAGCNPRREAGLVDLGELITSLPQRMTLLVSAATTKEADLKQALAAFRPFSLDGLVVTHMDETLTFGSIYNHACQSKLPVAYYTSDPTVMNGLSAGDGEILVNALFNEGI